MGLLENKVALVTGAASGIGRATAIMLAKEGAKVTVNGHVNIEGAMDTVRMIKDAGGEAIMVQADISKADQVEALVKRVVDTFGGLHCACASRIWTMSLAEVSPVDVRGRSVLAAGCRGR